MNETTYSVSFTEKELSILSGIFHEYKDCYRGCKEMLLPAMELESKMVGQTNGVYDPDPTYDYRER